MLLKDHEYVQAKLIANELSDHASGAYWSEQSRPYLTGQMHEKMRELARLLGYGLIAPGPIDGPTDKPVEDVNANTAEAAE